MAYICKKSAFSLIRNAGFPGQALSTPRITLAALAAFFVQGSVAVISSVDPVLGGVDR